jgi:hypothetical protein
MRNFVYIIGSMDDFESYEELETAYFENKLGDRNASVFHIQLRESAGTDALSLRDLATLVGRGLAFSNDWCMDGTFGDLLEA